MDFDFKTDYVHPFESGNILEVGFNSRLRSRDDSQLAYLFNATKELIRDDSLSNQFLYDENGTCYELVAPNGDGNPVDSILSGKKNVLNHVAYRVSDLDLQIDRFRERGCAQLGHPKAALAFKGARVVHFLTPLDIIIELIEEL